MFKQIKSAIKSTHNTKKKQSPSQAVGNLGESIAKQYLQTQGFVLVCAQFRTKMGEIDLIMKKKQTLIFIEVRYRENTLYGNPFESITLAKRRRIIRTALYYLKCRPWTMLFSKRFDVISISGDKLNPKITWIPNAFGVE
jgi:putative endonuclease